MSLLALCISFFFSGVTSAEQITAAAIEIPRSLPVISQETRQIGISAAAIIILSFIAIIASYLNYARKKIIDQMLREKKWLLEALELKRDECDDTRQQLEEINHLDELTGLCKAAHFYSALNNEVTRSQRYHTNLHLFVFSIDDFDEFAASYGSQEAGAQLLICADALNQTCHRETDIKARLTNEKFAVILPQISPEHALLLGQKLHQQMENLQQCTKTQKPRLSLSLGISSIVATSKPITSDALFTHTDKLRAQAQAQGGDKTIADIIEKQ